MMTESSHAIGPCLSCHRDDQIESVDHGLCIECFRSRATHPLWIAIQRVEHRESTVKRRGELEHVERDGYYWLELSDGWRIYVYSHGEPFSDWRNIESAVSPDGHDYQGDFREDPAHSIPASIWALWQPADDEASRRRWALLPHGWMRDPRHVDRVQRGEM